MTRLLASGAIVGPVLFTLAWIVLGLVSPGYTMWDIVIPSYSWISQPISGLGLGVTGPYMNAAFIIGGVLLFAGILGIVRDLTELPPRERRAIGVLFALAPVGMVVAGVFTLESFFLHFIGFLLSIGSLVVSFLVAGRALSRIPRLRALGRGLIVASPLTLVLLVISQLTFDPTSAGANVGIAGITQRILILEVLAWFVALGILTLTRPARSPVSVSGRLSIAGM
jgi:hypothetical protein